MSEYDSTADTLKHIKRVNELLLMCCTDLMDRAVNHDTSKMSPEEKELFDEYTPKLKGCTYGSDEYKGYLKGLGVALTHHYANNSHHPEAHEDGINGMTLLDILEMFMDWKAATERHDDGDIRRSIELNKERFGMSDQLCQILSNTADKMFPKENDHRSD
jgi:hypothetical protein